MKMIVYWVAKYPDSRGADLVCLAGPFPTWSEAFNSPAMENGMIVTQIVEVEL